MKLTGRLPTDSDILPTITTSRSPMNSPEEAPLNERQSLDLIHSMIRQAQGRFSEDGSHYLLWGWLVLIASVINYALFQTPYASYGGLAWLLMPAGGIGAWLIQRREAQQNRTRTYVDRLMGYIWGGVGVALGLTFIVASVTHSWAHTTYPMVLMIYGVGLFTSGGALRFRALIMGAMVCWSLAIVSAFLNFEHQLLCIAASMLAGYIVPGFLLRARFRQENTLPDGLRTV